MENPRELSQWGDLSPKELLEGILLGVYELTILAARQLEVSEQIRDELKSQPPIDPGQAVRGIFTIKGDNSMTTTPPTPGASFTVDEATGKGAVVLVDAKGDTNAPQPRGSTLVFNSDTPTVATAALDPAVPLGCVLSILGIEGTAVISPVFVDSAGNPIAVADDTTTPFAQPNSVTISVGPDQAIAGTFSVVSGAPA